jgi:hypothetical protein
MILGINLAQLYTGRELTPFLWQKFWLRPKSRTVELSLTHENGAAALESINGY